MTWALVEYEWFEETGLAELVYERTRNGETERRTEYCHQPYRPDHEGWRTHRSPLGYTQTLNRGFARD